MATIGAFFVIDNSQIIHHGNGAAGAFPLTFFAADTAGLAGFPGVGTLIMVAAVDNEADILWNNVDQVVGAFFGTQTTSDTQVQINLCQAVFNVNSAVGADRHAVTVAQAAIRAQGVTGKQQVGSRAAADAYVFMAVVNVLRASATGNIGNLSDSFTGFHAQGSGDID